MRTIHPSPALSISRLALIMVGVFILMHWIQFCFPQAEYYGVSWTGVPGVSVDGTVAGFNSENHLEYVGFKTACFPYIDELTAHVRMYGTRIERVVAGACGVCYMMAVPCKGPRQHV